ncbi:mesoderm development [Homalodisca vitripennis]|nr:mesoderm development [Homalodisca vitripennis]
MTRKLGNILITDVITPCSGLLFVFDVYSDDGSTIDGADVINALRAFNLNPTMQLVNSLGGSDNRGEVKYSFDDFWKIYLGVRDDKNSGGFSDFVECLKIYDIAENGTMKLVDLTSMLVTLVTSQCCCIPHHTALADSCFATCNWNTRPLSPDTVSALAALTYSTAAETTTIKDNDACLYLEYKHIHGRLRTDNFRNSKFNKALKEAEESVAAEASDISTQNEDCNYKKKDALSMSVKHLEESLTEENLLENSENEEEQLTLAAKIGTALLEENDSLNRQNFELESNLTIAEENAENLERQQEISASKIEELLCQIEELHNNSKKEKQIHSDMQRMFEEHDRKQNQIINEYLLKIDNLEKNIFALQRNLKKHMTSESDKESPSYTNSETQTVQKGNEQNINTLTPMPDNTTVFIELAEVKSKQHLLEEEIKTLKIEIAESKSHLVAKSNSNTTPSTLSKSYTNTDNKTCKRPQPLNKSQPSIKNRRNHFSISLQVVKSKSEQNPPNQPENTNKITPIPNIGKISAYKTLTEKLIPKERIPPMTAKLRADNESVEDFYVKSIDYYKEVIHKQSSSVPYQTVHQDPGCTSLPAQDNDSSNPQAREGRDKDMQQAATSSDEISTGIDHFLGAPPKYKEKQEEQ